MLLLFKHFPSLVQPLLSNNFQDSSQHIKGKAVPIGIPGIQVHQASIKQTVRDTLSILIHHPECIRGSLDDLREAPWQCPGQIQLES